MQQEQNFSALQIQPIFNPWEVATWFIKMHLGLHYPFKVEDSGLLFVTVSLAYISEECWPIIYQIVQIVN